MLVHRFDDEDVVRAGDAADGVRDSARRVAARFGFFIRTAPGRGVFDGVRERRGRVRVRRRQVERRVLDVRGADHHRETLVRSSDGRHERQGVGSVFVIPHRGEHGRIPVQRRRHHLPADGPRAPKLVPRGERERRLFPRNRGEIRAVRRDVLHGRFLRHRSSGGEGNLGVRRVTSGDPLELDVQLVTTRGVRQQGDVEGTSGRVGQIARRDHVRRRRSRSRRGERRRAVAVGERSRLVRNRVTVRVPSDYSDEVLHPRETAEEPRAVHGGRRRVQSTLRDGHGRRPGHFDAVQRGGERVGPRRLGRNLEVVVPAGFVLRRGDGDDVVRVGDGHSVERDGDVKGVVAVAGFGVTLRVAVRVRRVHAQHELVPRGRRRGNRRLIDARARRVGRARDDGDRLWPGTTDGVRSNALANVQRVVHRRRHRVRHRVRPVAVVEDDVGVVGAGVAGVFLRQSLGLRTPAGRRGPRQRHGEIRSAHRQADAVGVGRFDPEGRALARDRALEAVARSLEHRRRRRARRGHRLQTPIRTTRHRGTPEQDVELVLRPGARGRPPRRVRPVAVIRHRDVRVSGAGGRVHDVRSKRITAGDGVVSVCVPRANGDPTGAVHDGAAHPGAVHEALRRVRRPGRHRACERRVGHVHPAHRHANGRRSGNRRRVRHVVPHSRRVPNHRRRLDDVHGAARPERAPGYRHRHVHGGGDRRVRRRSRVTVSIGGDDVKRRRRSCRRRLQPGADDARGARVRSSGGDGELRVRGARSADAFAAEVHGDDVRLRGGDVEADDVLERRLVPRDSNRAAGARRGRVVGAGEGTRR